jgi:hypothetical protein
MQEEQMIRFRVANVYQRSTLLLSLNGEVLAKKKRPIMAPGEMEEWKVKRAWFEHLTDDATLTIEIMEGN